MSISRHSLLFIAAVIIFLVCATQVDAARTHHVRVYQTTVQGHRVQVCSWRPGSGPVLSVNYDRKHVYAVKSWKRMKHANCAMNGGTYTTAPGAKKYLPTGYVVAHGVTVTPGPAWRPTAGLVNGQLVFGQPTLEADGAQNVMNGLAYLIQNGKRQTVFPGTTPAQRNCSGRGTDTWYGCYRSCLVQFSNGRVGLVEIQLANMKGATTILKSMNVVQAITFDSGGAAELDTYSNRFGTSVHPHDGRLWTRLIPDSITVK